MYRVFPLIQTIVTTKTSNYYGKNFSKAEMEHLRHYVMLVEGTNSGLTDPEYVI
jgi:hypothetical protein